MRRGSLALFLYPQLFSVKVVDNKKDFDADLIVVGGGPGGATCAAIAARSGLRVVLLDRATFPRDKVCGDAISGKTISILRDLGLDDYFAQSGDAKMRGISFAGPYGDRFTAAFKLDPKPEELLCLTSKRVHFDDILFQRAKALGVDVRTPVSVTGLLRSTEGAVRGVTITAEGNGVDTAPATITAPLVVGADGAYSAVVRALGFTQLEPDHYSGGMRQYVQGVTGFEQGVIEIHYIDEVIPGYFWIFPLANGAANVGIGMLSSHLKAEKISLRKRLFEVLALPQFAPRFAEAAFVGKPVGWGLPMGSKPRTMHGDGWMLVGDAASLIDPLTGEGIGNAMLSGRFAAEQAIRAHAVQRFDAATLKPYQDHVLDKLGEELKIAHALQRLSRWKWLLNTVIKKASRNEELRNAITCMFDDLDSRRTLMGPGFYVRALLA